MAPPVTEFALLPLKSDCYPDDPDSPAGQTLRGLISTLLKQDGAQRVYWGREVEHPDMLYFLVDWDTMAHHEQFMASPPYKAFLDAFLTLLDGTPLLYHVPMTPHPPVAALSNKHSPFTEIVTAFFPPDYSGQDQAQFDRDFEELAKIVEEHAEGYKAVARGWAVEELDLPGKEDGAEKQKCKVWIGAIGWESMEMYRAFQQTEIFTQNIHLLTEAKAMQGGFAVHISGHEVSQ